MKESFILISCVVSPVQRPGALLGVIMEGRSSTKATEHLSTEERPRHKMYFPAKKSPLMSIKIPLKVRLMCSFHFNGLKLEQRVKFQKLGSGTESKQNELYKTIRDGGSIAL